MTEARFTERSFVPGSAGGKLIVAFGRAVAGPKNITGSDCAAPHQLPNAIRTAKGIFLTIPRTFPKTEQPAFALVNETTGRTLARNLSVASRLMPRFLGLMGRADFSEDSAMGLSQCDWVHTILVKFPIDIVYCDRAGKALTVIADLSPNRFASRAPGAFWAYEMRRGCLAPFVSPGDRLSAVMPPALAAAMPGGE